MPELPWREAVLTILQQSDAALHYTDIAEAIAERGLKTQVGATPAGSVNVTITASLRDEGDKSPFIRVDRGYYWLKSKSVTRSVEAPQASASLEEAGLINAFGMYWSRQSILWKNNPQILGQQQQSSSPVNFAKQNGVYLLHDGRAVVYVGRTTDQPLGVRLQQHTIDRLSSRWDRFSWFGVFGVSVSGELDLNPSQTFNISMLIATMEALLIEGLEPPQNRKRGDDFRAVEFLQVADPELEKSKIYSLMDELKRKL